MKSLRLAAALCAALILAGCASGAFQSIPNPITQSRADTLTASWGATLALYVAYQDACAQRLIAPSCRTVVAKVRLVLPIVQSQVKTAQSLAKQDTVNALDAVNAAIQAVDDFRGLITALGVR